MIDSKLSIVFPILIVIDRDNTSRFSGLLVRGQDLFQWAATSSREYFQLRQIQETEEVKEAILFKTSNINT